MRTHQSLHFNIRPINLVEHLLTLDARYILFGKQYFNHDGKVYDNGS